MNAKFPTPATRSRPRQHRTEVLRPFVQKHQYIQLTLPEPAWVDGEPDETERAFEPVESHLQE